MILTQLFSNIFESEKMSEECTGASFEEQERRTELYQLHGN